MQQIAHASAITAIKPSSPSLILLTRKLQPETHFQTPIISAKWGKRRSGSRRSQKLILDSIAFLASNLKILPEPLDSLAREFLVSAGGGNGGKFWVRKGFGGGDGRNRRGVKLGFWLALMISSALAFWVVIERERGSDNDSYIWVVMVVSAFAVYCVVRGWRRDVMDGLLGFSCGAAFMGLCSRNHQDLGKWLVKFRANFPNFMSFSKRRKARRWL